MPPFELKIPSIGESVTEAFIGRWLKREGERVEKDEPIAELESEKANVELPSPVAGRVSKLLKGEGDTAKVGEVIAQIDEAAEATATTEEAPPARLEPAKKPAKPKAEPEPKAKVTEPTPAPEPAPRHEPEPVPAGDRPEEIVPMSPMRQTIARRLVQAQHTAALLTTFNEIDMSAVIALRKQVRDAFETRYQIKLGFMSFFVKAVIDALKQHPVLNAEIRGDKIVYKNYFDIGIAVSTERGLVVPVVRNAERLSFAEIERAIDDFAKRAAAGKLEMKELEGGTFTITNGGVFGSLMSTPIVNPPQSGVLGMHAIQERPVAIDGQVVIRPMMYVALTYDHRIVDGKGAVTFLRRVKEVLEQPARMLVEI